MTRKDALKLIAGFTGGSVQSGQVIAPIPVEYRDSIKIMADDYTRHYGLARLTDAEITDLVRRIFPTPMSSVSIGRVVREINAIRGM